MSGIAGYKKKGKAHVRSHHKGHYHVINGSNKEGRIRRGPRRKISTIEGRNGKRRRWRESKARKRGYSIG